MGALARWIKRIEAAPRSTRRPLIVQGEEDMTVDWQHNLQVLRGKFDQPEVLMLKRGRLTEEEWTLAKATPLVFARDGIDQDACMGRRSRALRNARPTNPLKK